jgi:hypothetical protein
MSFGSNLRETIDATSALARSEPDLGPDSSARRSALHYRQRIAQGPSAEIYPYRSAINAVSGSAVVQIEAQ